FYASVVALYIPLLFFFTGTATPALSTLSLHDALPICDVRQVTDHTDYEVLSPAEHDDRIVYQLGADLWLLNLRDGSTRQLEISLDRKSTRLNSSHVKISYAVFCLKKKSTKTNQPWFTY